MRSHVSRRVRRMTGLAAAACVASLSLIGGAAPAASADAPLSISVSGNHFVNGDGDTVRLLGVNRTSSEYGCVDGFGYDDGHFDNKDAAEIASWGADAVRVPLNEDCWLGINGQPNSDQGADPKLTQAGYQTEIENYVADLNDHGLYAILDLHWTAPGTQVALEQQPMPDMDHSPAFWTSVATTFKDNPAVVFDLFNEPYDPTDTRSGTDQNSSDAVTWGCWQTGRKPDLVGGGATDPCVTQAYDENDNPTTKYQIAGMQTLLDAVRATGAMQPVLLGGLNFSNALGSDWLDHEPTDSAHAIAASFHNYTGQQCDTISCWNSTIAPVADDVPVVTGEFDEDNFDQAKCRNKTPSTFDEQYMTWADAHGVSYLAWGWIVETQGEQNSDGCSDYVLITNYGNYAAAAPNGVALYRHLQALAAGNEPAITLNSFGAKLNAAGTRIAFALRGEASHGTLSAATVRSFPTANGRHPVAVGTNRFTITNGKTTTDTLTMSPASRRLLAANGSLALRVTITLMATGHQTTVVHRTITLR